MYGHVPPNALHSPPMGNEQVVFLAPSPGLASSYGAASPMAPSPLQFPAQGAPQLTGMSSPAAYGCGPVIGVQVPMWAHVPQTSPTVIGNMMPYPTQPLQYQPCFMPPLQHTNHGVYFNNQMQSYSIVPHQYIPVPNRGFRQHFPVGQPPNVPYVLPHDYVPVANSGFAHTIGGTPSLHPQFLPTELHAREAVYEMSTVQQAQYVPQYATPVQQYQQMSGVVQKRAGIVNQHTYVTREDQEIQKMLPNSEEQSGVGAVHLLQEEESSEMHKPVRSDVNTVPASSEQAPTPSHQHILDSTESIQVPHQHMLDSTESNQVPHQHMLDSTESIQAPHQLMLDSTESMQAPHQHMLDSTESIQPDAAVSPSQMTLVPSPSSSDGVQTVCSSPVQSDTEEDDMTAAEDDQIPTKDTSDDVTPHHFSVEVYNLDNVERLEPEQLYDSARQFKQEQCNSFSQTKEEINSLQSREISGSSSVTQGAEVTSQHSFIKHSAQPCISSENMTSTNQIQRHHHQPIRSLIDTPVYNTAHSRVLNQLAQPDTSSARPHKGTPTRPLTTHFRQLFKPIPYSASKSATKEDRRS